MGGYKLANTNYSMAEIVIDAKCPKLPPRPYFHYIRENVSHRSYEATGCIRFAVLEAHWVKVNSIVLAFRYLSSLRSKTKECPKLPLFTLPQLHVYDCYDDCYVSDKL